jgi:hypothetical protein
VNPANPQQLFVTYTDQDFSGFFGGPTCPNKLGTSIKMVSSNNGGSTWSSPVTVANEVCIDTGSSIGAIVEFSQVAVDPRGTAVYVAWESFDGGMNLPTREIDIAASALPTTSFGGFVKVSSVNYAGGFDSIPPQFGSDDGSLVDQNLQGRILAFERPSLAIGKGPKNTGVLYVTWNDGDNAVADVSSASGFYHFTDVLLTSSTDGGNNWSSPVHVNNNVENGTTVPFTDQFHPTVASDKTGKIGVCFYDRRNDPLNFLIGRTCAVSINGNSWTNVPIDLKGGPSVVNQDPTGITDWLGDYETLATDGLNQSAGFIGGYTNTSAGYQNIRENAL